jgi:excisionase family DNA binding protein
MSSDRHTQIDRATPDLLPIGQVAAIFNVSVKTVRNWEDAGKLAAIRTPGGQRRFRRSDVLALTDPAS